MFALACLLSLGPRSGTTAASETLLDEAREALGFWNARRSGLPWVWRSARAEARTMVWRWRARLVRAYLEHWHLGFLASRLAPLRPAAEHGSGAHSGWLGVIALRRVARRARRLLFAAAAAAAVTVLAALALPVFVAGQLI